MLNLILLTSLFSLGFFIVGQQGFVLGGIRRRFANSLGGYLRFDDNEAYYDFEGHWTGELFKPIWGCPTCMSSFWGVISYLLLAEVSIKTFYELPILIFGVACINFIVYNNFIKKFL